MAKDLPSCQVLLCRPCDNFLAGPESVSELGRAAIHAAKGSAKALSIVTHNNSDFIYPTSLSVLHNLQGRYDFYLHLQMSKQRQRERESH